MKDPISFTTLIVVAAIEAINETLKLEPDVLANAPPFLFSPAWHFAPAVILTIAGLIWIARAFGWIGKKQKPLEDIRNRNFQNEIVNLDGKYFHDCTFDNVIFRYQGRNFYFVGAKVTGHSRLETQNISVLGAVEILKLVGFLTPEFASSWNPRLPPNYFKERP
ncbi:MAG TPA: hypothetical protein VII35_08680 [Steroidobacteraceae bacterium]